MSTNKPSIGAVALEAAILVLKKIKSIINFFPLDRQQAAQTAL